MGITILVAYMAFGLSAPILTKYDPLNSQFLSGELGRPTWWKYLPGGDKLSENYNLLDKPGFTQLSSLQDQGWAVNSQPSTIPVQYDPSLSISFPGTPILFPGSEGISYARTAGRPTPVGGQAEVTVSKVFQWTYNGPPKRFMGSLSLVMTNMTGVNNVDVTVFISKEEQPIPIWTQTLTTSLLNTPIIPGFALDSYSSSMKLLFGPTIDPGSFIFFEKGTYTYGLKVSISDSNPANDVKVKINFNGFNLQFKGTSFGLLGTDQYGRDIFSQLAWGTRVSLLVGLVASILAIGIGLLVGLVAGFLGKLVDEVLMRFTDLLLVLPGLPLLIVLAALLGASFWNVILILGLLGWPGFARIIRSQVLTLKERSFIEASRAAGSGMFHIISRHVVPNVMGLTYVNLALSVPTAIVSEAALSFLGLWDPTAISWGRMLFDVQNNGATASWWWVLPPGLSIAILSLSFVLLGYALDEMLNPRLRMRR